jgi:molybdate transport repressor ModE-like protein
MLNTHRVEILCAVARTGSLAAAAQELSYSTPAVWQHMRRLEREVGHPLLIAHARGVHLTSAGRALVHHGEQLMRRIRLAEAELAAIARLEAGEVRIAAFATAGSGLLPRPIAQFRAAHPGVHVALSEQEPTEALHRLHDGEIDLAVVFTYDDATPDASKGLALTHLLEDPLYVVAPADHPLAQAQGLTLKEARGATWLEGSYAPAQEGDDGARPRSRLAYRGGDFHTVQRLVAAGAGLAAVPRLALGPVSRDIVVRPLLGESHSRRHVFAATARPPSVTLATRRFLELLVADARALQSDWRVTAP